MEGKVLLDLAPPLPPPQLRMVRTYTAPVRVYKHPFEFLMAAYERRFPVCPLVPQLLATDVLREEKSDDGAHHTVERRCTVDFEVPYILRKITGQEVMYFIQRNELDWRTRTLNIYTHNETFSSRIIIKEHCKYYVHPRKSQWTCFDQSASLEVNIFWGFESLVEGLAVRLYSGSLQKGKEIMHHFISELHSEGVFHVPQWGAAQEEKERDLLPGCRDKQVITLFLSQLTEEEEHALRELREQTAAVLKAGMVPDDLMLLRFLRARQFHVGEARLALMHSLAWRRQHYLSHLAEWVPPPLLSQYFPGGWTDTDKEGHPVFVLRLGAMDVPGLLKAFGELALLRFLLQHVEEGMRRAEESTQHLGKPVSSCTVVCDLEGLSLDLLQRPGVSVLERFLQLVREHYPGILGSLLLVHCLPEWPGHSPFSSLLGTTTIAREAGALSDHIPPEHIPDFLGGTWQWTYPKGGLCVPGKLYGQCECSDEDLGFECLYQPTTVPRGDPLLVPVVVMKPQQVVQWEWEVVRGEVEFTLLRPTGTVEGTRVEAEQVEGYERLLEPELGRLGEVRQGSYECVGTELLALHWVASPPTPTATIMFSYEIIGTQHHRDCESYLAVCQRTLSRATNDTGTLR